MLRKSYHLQLNKKYNLHPLSLLFVFPVITLHCFSSSLALPSIQMSFPPPGQATDYFFDPSLNSSYPSLHLSFRSKIPPFLPSSFSSSYSSLSLTSFTHPPLFSSCISAFLLLPQPLSYNLRYVCLPPSSFILFLSHSPSPPFSPWVDCWKV